MNFSLRTALSSITYHLSFRPKAALAFISFFLSFSPAGARIVLPMFFSDGMVLQQQAEVRLWGWADRFYGGTAGRTVTVTTSWNGKSYTSTSDSDGRFEIVVQTPVAGGPYDITFNDGEQSRLRNVLIGEVWLCSGQSNMEMQMKGFKGQPVEGATEELLQCGDSLLRLFYAGRQARLNPHRDAPGSWKQADAASVRNFSATAYYFGKALRRTLGVPVGLICTAYGGSACEAWMKDEWLRDFPQVQLPVTATDLQQRQQRCPTALYNGQLSPLIGYGMRGVIWYQGEDNVTRADYYAPLFARMIQGWRSEWKQGTFPFYYCQIAPYDYSLIDWGQYNSALLREQQARVEAMVDSCRMAVLMDAGLQYGIHPRKKRQAGERLAILALANTYGVQGLPEFAAYQSVEFHGDTAVVAFSRSREWVYFENGPTSNNFEIAGSDRVFHPAQVWTSRNRVYVRSSEVPQPVAVRYAFHDWVVGDLMHDGLPVSSFRTDDW
ncbi:MAG: sialate O-acetylesterase [Prevotella sp.]|nr:sialate O-acetylesterase [Prevotella sp.]